MSSQSDGRHVLVGYDGSEEGGRVLRWAAEEARLRYLPLVVCHAYHWPFPTPPGDERILDALAHTAESVLGRGMLIARQFDPAVEVKPRLAKGSAAGALVARSADAELIVVGSRGSGGFADLPVGSVPVQVAAHASCPTLVVRDAPRKAEPEHVAVGIDNSPASEAALGFAFEEAALRRASVQIVHSWWDPGGALAPSNAPVLDVERLRREAAARFQRTIAPWLEKHRGVEARTSFVLERPVQALVAATRDAALLVVGNRGIGSAPELLLGPVARAMLHQAPCPVAIAPAKA